jgi:hypothetical protein
VGVDSQSFSVTAQASGSYSYSGVVGAHVFARFTGRCGREGLVDVAAVDSNPVVVPPTITPPFAVQRTDNLAFVDADQVPGGVEVELVNLRVHGNPRGDEQMLLRIRGPGVDFSTTLSADEFAAGQAVLSPRIVARAPGELVIEVAFLGTEATPVTLRVVDDPGPGAEGEGEGEPPLFAGSTGCAAGGAGPNPGPGPGGLLFLAWVPWWARRRCLGAQRGPRLADNGPVAVRALLPFLLLLALPFAAAGGCDDEGTFDGGFIPDGGPPPGGVDPADIGKPCVFSAAIGENPANQCANGLECMMVSRDGVINTLGLAIPAWEDQFTVQNNDGSDTGYCTLVGNLQNPPQCPAGTQAKIFTSFAAPDGRAVACLRTCNASAQCPRSGDVCDPRFLDDGAGATTGFCVKSCQTDIPDCVRLGQFQVENGSLIPAMLLDDIQGGAVCDRSTGFCADALQKGTGSHGTPCTDGTQCAPGLACYQAPLFGGQASELGFCAARCAVDPQDGNFQGTCPVGTTCQPGLHLGFPEMIVITSDFQSLDSAVGVCFQRCSTGNLNSCDAFAGTQCRQADQRVMGAPWNNIAQCLPPQVAFEG